MKLWGLQSEQKVLPFLEFLRRRCQLKVAQPSKGILYTSLSCSDYASSAIQHQPGELLITSPDSPDQFLHLALTKACPQKASELISQTSVYHYRLLHQATRKVPWWGLSAERNRTG